MNNLINLIRLSNLNKNKIIKIPIKKKNAYLLKILIQLNFIKFIKIEKKSFFINLNKKIIKIKSFLKLKKKKITLKELKKITLKKKNLILISSNIGIINNITAYNNNVGGILIANIFI